MKVLLSNNQNKKKIPIQRLKRKAQIILSALECNNSELSIVFVDDEEIQNLNEKYLNRNRPTNVISFPMQEGEFSGVNPDILGDVVISVDTAEKEANEIDVSLEDRLTELLLHGILHLVGYDHENNDEKEAYEMELKNNEIMSIINSQIL
ncbi:MAG: rRNA maturation RNase YbeY [Desulfobacterales bacterium]|nr:rRNA maturation RNase YbeY [Desulfobacterales bacterium]